MSDVKLTKTQDDLSKTLKEMTDRAGSSGGFSRIYPIYQKYQLQRFQTKNASEGKPWPDYKRSDYAEYKKKRFKSYPGSGSKMMIATSTLAGAVIGRGPHSFYGVDKHRVLFKKNSMEVYVEESGNNAQGKPFTYPSAVAEERPFMEFSDSHLDEMREELAKYVLGF
jgi:hypothetical protein